MLEHPLFPPFGDYSRLKSDNIETPRGARLNGTCRRRSSKSTPVFGRKNPLFDEKTRFLGIFGDSGEVPGRPFLRLFGLFCHSAKTCQNSLKTTSSLARVPGPFWTLFAQVLDFFAILPKLAKTWPKPGQTDRQGMPKIRTTRKGDKLLPEFYFLSQFSSKI